MSHEEDQLIPNLFPLTSSPGRRSSLTLSACGLRHAAERQEARWRRTDAHPGGPEDKWDRGIPRINTLFQKDRHTLPWRGWRVRQTSSSTR